MFRWRLGRRAVNGWRHGSTANTGRKSPGRQRLQLPPQPEYFFLQLPHGRRGATARDASSARRRCVCESPTGDLWGCRRTCRRCWPRSGRWFFFLLALVAFAEARHSSCWETCAAISTSALRTAGVAAAGLDWFSFLKIRHEAPAIRLTFARTHTPFRRQYNSHSRSMCSVS